jgi:hypothetical protein
MSVSSKWTLARPIPPIHYELGGYLGRVESEVGAMSLRPELAELWGATRPLRSVAEAERRPTCSSREEQSIS